MHRVQEVYKCKCEKCGHGWVTKEKKLPQRCAKCNAKGWDGQVEEVVEDPWKFYDIQWDEQSSEYYAVIWNSLTRQKKPSRDERWKVDINRVMKERGLD